MSPALSAGEELLVPERVVVAPTLGVFRLLPPGTGASLGDPVAKGQAVGLLLASGEEVIVQSAFDGVFMGTLAVEGERVREGQPVAWLTVS